MSAEPIEPAPRNAKEAFAQWQRVAQIVRAHRHGNCKCDWPEPKAHNLRACRRHGTPENATWEAAKLAEVEARENWLDWSGRLATAPESYQFVPNDAIVLARIDEDNDAVAPIEIEVRGQKLWLVREPNGGAALLSLEHVTPL